MSPCLENLFVESYISDLRLYFGENQSGTRPLNGKMGVEEGNLEGLIATSGGIATPKLIDMLVYNANKKYLQAFKRLLKK